MDGGWDCADRKFVTSVPAIPALRGVEASDGAGPPGEACPGGLRRQRLQRPPAPTDRACRPASLPPARPAEAAARPPGRSCRPAEAAARPPGRSCRPPGRPAEAAARPAARPKLPPGRPAEAAARPAARPKPPPARPPGRSRRPPGRPAEAAARPAARPKPPPARPKLPPAGASAAVTVATDAAEPSEPDSASPPALPPNAVPPVQIWCSEPVVIAKDEWTMFCACFEVTKVATTLSSAPTNGSVMPAGKG
ncbi:hypothetical protein [Actinoplanes nipponensis]|uniref:hypothetical protein n=1 Tax=Actinoplanes nipponensis TaxID=135950 RepID=UPI003616D86D